jgi:hypothetical protein
VPTDPNLAERLAADLVDLYTTVETRLATDIARRLASGLDRPDWAERKLAEVGRLRRWAQNLTGRLEGQLGEQVGQTLTLAYMRGGAAGLAEVATLQSTHADWIDLAGLTRMSDRLRAAVATRQGLLAAELADLRTALPGIDAVQRLQFSLTAKLRGTHLRITRWAEDAYRQVVGRAAPDVLLGLATRRRATQVAWERLLEQGVTGFVDRGGRRWNLASYVEMSTRTHVAQAAVEGHLDRLAAAGLDLVIVSDAPQECHRCRPWEGEILTRSGGGQTVISREHATEDGHTVKIQVAGSVDDAVRGGLLHPNCRHSLSAYLPGVTKQPTGTADPQGDADRQRLRTLERQVRRDKLQAAGALTPQAQAAARGRVRAGQASIRDHVASSSVFRQPHREQINLGHSPPGLRPTRPTIPPPAPAPQIAQVALTRTEVRQAVEAELSRQSSIAPQAAGRLRRVSQDWDHDADGTLAYFDRSFAEIHLHPDWSSPAAPLNEASVRMSTSSGWWTPSGAAGPLQTVVAHEYGHHITVEMFRVITPGGARRLLETIRDQLGIPLDAHLDQVGLGMAAVMRRITAAVRNHPLVVDRVSGYAATNGSELLAEVWQEYSTMGDRARPHIRAIGDVMRDLAEQQ